MCTFNASPLYSHGCCVFFMEYFRVCVDGGELVASFPSKVEGGRLVAESDVRLKEEALVLGDEWLKVGGVLKGGRGAYALQLLEGLVAEFPSCFLPRCALGDFFSGGGLFGLAAASYDVAVRCAPDLSLEYRALGSSAGSLLMQGCRYIKAGDFGGARYVLGLVGGFLEQAGARSLFAHPSDAVMKEFSHASWFYLLASFRMVEGAGVVEGRGLLSCARARCELVRQLLVCYDLKVDVGLDGLEFDIEKLGGVLQR